MANSTRRKPRGKRSKPLGLVGLHKASGRWVKKYRGVEGRQAEQQWLRELEGGSGHAESRTVRYVCNKFMSSKRSLVDSGEMAVRSFGEYIDTCRAMCEVLGKFRPVDELKPPAIPSLSNRLS